MGILLQSTLTVWLKQICLIIFKYRHFQAETDLQLKVSEVKKKLHKLCTSNKKAHMLQKLFFCIQAYLCWNCATNTTYGLNIFCYPIKDSYYFLIHQYFSTFWWSLFLLNYKFLFSIRSRFGDRTSHSWIWIVHVTSKLQWSQSQAWGQIYFPVK